VRVSSGAKLQGLAAAACAAALALSLASPAPARGRIYVFVDADGLAHFTNVPNDTRYVPLAPEPPPERRARAAPTRWEYDGLIGLAARQYRVPPALVKAVIAAESKFDPSAVSRKGARGLMQLMPATAQSLGVADPLRPDENVDGGVRYLRRMIERYGDLPRALAAYNAGPEAVDRFGGIPPYRETRDYVKRVLTYYRAYHGDFGR
jgi:soluble lytic murein transglycosylase-like protein